MPEIDFNNIDCLRKIGFEGFIPIAELKESKCKKVPDKRGVYLVIYTSDTYPIFLDESIGGHFKNIDPKEDTNVLINNWIENTKVIYIGKAGAENNKSTLKTRIWCYMKFGMKKKVGHRGGRYIWQIEDSDSLQICWKPTPNENPRDVERNLITEFENQFGRLPFANLRH